MLAKVHFKNQDYYAWQGKWKNFYTENVLIYLLLMHYYWYGTLEENKCSILSSKNNAFPALFIGSLIYLLLVTPLNWR